MWLNRCNFFCAICCTTLHFSQFRFPRDNSVHIHSLTSSYLVLCRRLIFHNSSAAFHIKSSKWVFVVVFQWPLNAYNSTHHIFMSILVLFVSMLTPSISSDSHEVAHCSSYCCGRVFPVTAAQFWNRLPDNVTSANSLLAFQQQLKHTLFQQSFPDIIMWHFLTVTPIVVLAVASLLRSL